MEDRLTTREAYLAMLRFLEAYHGRGPTEELAILLGSLAFSADGHTMDPASWHDWLSAVRDVRRSGGGTTRE